MYSYAIEQHLNVDNRRIVIIDFRWSVFKMNIVIRRRYDR